MTAPRFRMPPVSAHLGTRRPGVALLTALVVVLLLTMFLSELFFATGLELRALESFKDAAQARRLARSVLKATEIGLLQDEVEFFKGYSQLQQVMTLSTIPIEGGRLVTLAIIPADGLFNVNDIGGKQANSPENIVRFAVFQNLMAQILVPATEPGAPPAPPDEALVSQIYAALSDWLDSDDDVGVAPDNTSGAEAPAYQSQTPEYTPKNGPLDRLEEMRLVLGFAEAHIPWREIERRFIVRTRSPGGSLYPEKINVNVASRQEIADFLQARKVETSELNNNAVQKGVNQCADLALDIAAALVPDGEARPVYGSINEVQTKLNAAGVSSNVAKEIFTTISQYYRVVITTEVGDIQTHLSALVFVNRNAGDRTAKTAEVQQIFFN